MVDDKGITDNQKKAKYLVVLKSYGDTAFERLDYNFAGPMISRATFLDSNLSVLNGASAQYSAKGYLSLYGQYDHNMKDGNWYGYDDTSHAITKFVYHLDTLLSTIDLDSLSKEDKKIKEDTTDQHEAEYMGGAKKILKIIQSNIQIPDRTSSLIKGGTVNIKFVINTTGKPIDLEVLKSVEFAFDEESLRVVSLLKDWTPASVKGRKVNAYRIQPITVSLD